MNTTSKQTPSKQVLRELLANEIRENIGKAPGDLADAIIEMLHIQSPKSFVDQIQFDADGKYESIARELIKTAACNVDTWEIQAYNRNLNDEEVRTIDDLIGQSSVEVHFN